MTGLKRNLTTLMRATMYEFKTAAQSTVHASGPIKAARENWLNGIVEKSLVELSARNIKQLKTYGKIQVIIEESRNEEELGYNAGQAGWRET